MIVTQACPTGQAACSNGGRGLRDPARGLYRSEHQALRVLHDRAHHFWEGTELGRVSAKGSGELAIAPTMDTTLTPSASMSDATVGTAESDHSRSTGALALTPTGHGDWGNRLLPALEVPPRFGSLESPRRSSLRPRSEDPVRDRLLTAVGLQPGLTFSRLRQVLGLASGTVTYHARVLEREGRLYSVRVGSARKYYSGTLIGVRGTFELGPTQSRIVRLLRSHPGALQAELASWLSLPRQNVNYAVKQLVRRGYIRVDQTSRSRKPCYLSHSGMDARNLTGQGETE